MTLGVPSLLLLLCWVQWVQPIPLVKSVLLTIIQTRNQRTENSGSLGPSWGREVGHADSRSGEKDLNPPLSPYYLPLALDVQLTLETSPSLGNKPSSTSKWGPQASSKGGHVSGLNCYELHLVVSHPCPQAILLGGLPVSSAQWAISGGPSPKDYFSWKWNTWGHSMHPTYRGGN